MGSCAVGAHRFFGLAVIRRVPLLLAFVAPHVGDSTWVHHVDPAFRINQGGGGMGRSKITLTLFVWYPSFVSTRDVFLTGIPVIRMSIFNFIKWYWIGIPWRIPVLVVLGAVLSWAVWSATSLTVSMVLGLVGRVVRVLAFFTIGCGML